MSERRMHKALPLPLRMIAGRVSSAASARMLRFGAQTSRPGGVLHGAGLAVLLLLGAVLLPVAPALAQNQPIVSNLEELSGVVGGVPGEEIGNSFTTGSNPGGYTLTNAVVSIGLPANSVTVSIYSDSGGLSGTSLGTLTGPSTIAAHGHYTYTALPGIALSSSATYRIGVTNAFLRSTQSQNQVSPDNWTIGDRTFARLQGGTWSPIQATNIMAFSISALRILGFGGSTIADQTYTAGTAITDLTLPAASGGSGNNSYTLTPNPPAGLLFNPATRVLSGTPGLTMAASAYTYTATDVVSTSSTSLNFTIRVVPGVSVSPTALAVTEGGSANYTLVLNAAPAAAVTIAVMHSGDTDLSAMPNLLTFTAAAWDTALTVAVSAADDGDEVNGVARFSHTATSADSRYDNIPIAVLVATERDSDGVRMRLRIFLEGPLE